MVGTTEERIMFTKYLQWLAKKRLIWKFSYVIEVDKIMEKYMTQAILNGGSQEFLAESRKKLAGLQGDIKSRQELVNFLKQR